MPGWAELLVLLVMLVGAVGTLVPLVPGLPLIWLAGLVWVLADGGGPTRWAVLGVMTAIAAVGMAAAYVLPGRAVGRSELPGYALVLAIVTAVAGFFLVPLVGLPLGFAVGLFAAAAAHTRDLRAAWSATVAALMAYGIGILISAAAAGLMIAIWLGGLAVT